MGMDRQTVMSMRVGEFSDMMACLSIYNGTAQPKAEKKRLTFEEAMRIE